MSMKVCHMLLDEKFTECYIDFMLEKMTEYDHFFIVKRDTRAREWIPEGKYCNERVFFYTKKKQQIFDAVIRKRLKQSDKIIISGFFGCDLCTLWPKSLVKKTYIQFWGADFYGLRDCLPSNQIVKKFLHNRKKRLFRECGGLIFLIDGEYDKFVEISKVINDRHFVAGVPGNFIQKFDFERFTKSKVDNVIRIVVGNSATSTNCHEEVFSILKKFIDEDIEIICPLVYGDNEYASKIVQKGYDIFGKKFHPLTEWMTVDAYYSFLSRCDIGIFNNNRQQGMGNICALLAMGKKVYLNRETSMYESYINNGYLISTIDEIDGSFDKFTCFDGGEQNIMVSKWFLSASKYISEWRTVFEA